MRALLPIVLALPLGAQTLPTPSLLNTPTVVPIHTMAPDPVGGGGGTFAVGGDYKVRFDGGAEFVPYLGSGYPHNQPFAWRTTAVTIGENALPLRAPRATIASPTECRFDLGAAIESWHVRVDGLEQTFVFAQRPGVGELRIRGAVTTALRAANGDHGHAAVTFVDDAGIAILGYGACTAVDANGARFAMRTVVGENGRTIDLVLGANDAAAATWPIVVDPLLTNTLLSTSATPPLGQPRAVDVARDDENNQLLVSIQRHASATDEDLFLRLYSDGFAASLGLVFADTDTTWDTTDGHVTFVGGADRWVAAFTRAFDSTGTKQIRWHPHVAASTVLDTTVGFLIPPAGFSDLRATVGGYAGFATNVNAVLVWQRDQNLGAGGTHTFDDVSRVYFARVDVTGTTGAGGAGTLGVVTEVTGTDPAGLCDRERPTINKLSSGTSASDFLIAFQTYWNAAPGGVDDWDVEGRRIDSTGAFLPGVWISARNFPNDDHKLGPIVDGSFDEYVIAYTLANNTIIPFKTLAIEGSRVACESYDFGVPAIGASQILANTGFVKSLVVTGLAYDTTSASHALVVHHDVVPDSVTVTKLGYQNLIVEQATAYSTVGHVATGGGACFDDDSLRFPFVFGVEDGANQPVQGNIVNYVATPTPAVYGTAGCGPGLITWSSFHRIGHEFGALQVISSTPSSIALAVFSFGQVNVPLAGLGFGTCNLLVDVTAPNYIDSRAAVTDASGFAATPIPIPEQLAPFTVHCQWFTLNGPTTNTKATQGLTVVFDR